VVKLALAIVALLCLAAVAIVAGLVRHAHIDEAGQGVLLLDGKQSAECRDGGGCMAWSAREIQAVQAHAAGLAAAVAIRACGRRDL
jgi:Tfp pilus assembly protein PilN